MTYNRFLKKVALRTGIKGRVTLHTRQSSTDAHLDKAVLLGLFSFEKCYTLAEM